MEFSLGCLVFFCLPLVWIQTVHAGCPTGWKMSANNCILIRDVSLSWAAAQRNCKNDNSDLASFSDPVDELFLLKALSANSPHWVGYQSSPSDPGWLDGTSEATNTRFTASSMTSGSGASHLCGNVLLSENEAHPLLLWRLDDCTLPLPFLCKMAPGQAGVLRASQGTSSQSRTGSVGATHHPSSTSGVGAMVTYPASSESDFKEGNSRGQHGVRRRAVIAVHASSRGRSRSDASLSEYDAHTDTSPSPRALHAPRHPRARLSAVLRLRKADRVVREAKASVGDLCCDDLKAHGSCLPPHNPHSTRICDVDSWPSPGDLATATSHTPATTAPHTPAATAPSSSDVLVTSTLSYSVAMVTQGTSWEQQPVTTLQSASTALRHQAPQQPRRHDNTRDTHNGCGPDDTRTVSTCIPPVQWHLLVSGQRVSGRRCRLSRLADSLLHPRRHLAPRPHQPRAVSSTQLEKQLTVFLLDR
ncbi:uncharacterized protein LOC112564445 [Pomacea canaliculata]|uniref:uncharacterized protein LOC112564445 n=1 Tax=Pomacea canaliculata TaxID=400727 RepID=UPI000D739E56|nr:uncharacterized protein LOC112564445 [Pomacea canaliculata]